MILPVLDLRVKELISMLLFLIILTACNDQHQVSKPEQEIKAVFPPPVTVLLDTMPPPKIVLLKDAPAPRMVKVPKTTGGSYILETEAGKEKILLSPPLTETVDALSPHFTNINMEKGLVMDAVYCSLFDKKGNLWIGTGGGVSLFDGNRFTNFSSIHGLGNSSIRGILEGENGNIWFATQGDGIIRYDGVRFTVFSKKDGLADDLVVCALKDKKGHFWFGTVNAGVSRYDGKGFTNFDTSHGLPSNNVNALGEDNSGQIWIGTYGSGVCRLDPEGKKRNECFSTAQGLVNNLINFIKPDSMGNLWIGTEGGVSRFDGMRFTNFTSEHGLPDNNVTCMEEVDNDIWFGTLGGGVSRFDGSRFETYTTDHGLAHNTIHTITKDHQDKLWFGTAGGGMSLYNGKQISSFPSGNVISKNLVFGITEDSSGNLWFGSEGTGVYRYDGKNMTNFTTGQGLGNNMVNCITTDKTGKIWFGTSTGGISVYEPGGIKGFKTFTTAQGLANNYVLSIFPDSKGCLWFATANGVSRFKPDGDSAGFTSYSTDQGLAHNLVFSIAEGHDGSIWLGTSGGGVSRFDGKRFFTYDTTHGLVNNHVMKILRDRGGNMWFGTQGGLSRFDASGFISYTTANGLADNFIYVLDEDEKGVLWLGTNLGLTGLKFKSPPLSRQPGETIGAGLITVSNEELKTYEIVCDIYNIKTGYPVKDLNKEALYVTSLRLPFGSQADAGTLWGGTGDKVIRFDPRAVVKNNKPPSVFIRSVGIDESSVNWYGIGKKNNDSTLTVRQEVMVFGNILSARIRDSLYRKFADIRYDSITPFYQVPQNLVLPYRHNRITIEYGTIETGRPFMVRYQYMLEGYDKEWSAGSEKTSISYGNISEGSYTFKLKAMSPDGVWSEPIAYNFKVFPPWWRTVWAYLVYISMFSAAIYAFIQWRIKNLKQEKINLEEKVSQRTRQLEQKSGELQQSLENLKATQAQLVQSEKMASLGELTAGIAHEIQNPLNFVNNFSEVSKELINEMKDEIEKIGNTDLKHLASDIENNLDKINHHGKRADAIVKGMLQHSRISSGQKEPININALADEYLKLAYQGMRAKDKTFNTVLETDFDESFGKINIIPQDIGRVLLNLYNNAFYAVAEKQKLSTEGYQPTVSVRTRKVNGEVEISVADNGNGIPEKLIDKVFQPFFTTKPTGQGTGLGLSLSYDIIKAHQGKISIRNSPGSGAEFIISFPVH